MTVVFAELLALWALRAELWRKAGLGWFFAAMIVAAALIVVAAARAFRWLIAHRFRFSLKALLVTVLLVGASLGFLERTRKQRNAAAILTGLGASVSYAGDDEPGLRTLIGRQYFESPIAMFVGSGFQGSDLPGCVIVHDTSKNF